MRSTFRQAANSREREVAEISAGLKALARELKVPAAVPIQLNWRAETRTGSSAGVPRMSDLLESGSIVQNADMTGLLYCSDYYAGDEDQRQQLAGYRQFCTWPKTETAHRGLFHFEAEPMHFSTREPSKNSAQMGRFSLSLFPLLPLMVIEGFILTVIYAWSHLL